jgi:hypothetical protein
MMMNEDLLLITSRSIQKNAKCILSRFGIYYAYEIVTVECWKKYDASSFLLFLATIIYELEACSYTGVSSKQVIQISMLLIICQYELLIPLAHF